MKNILMSLIAFPILEHRKSPTKQRMQPNRIYFTVTLLLIGSLLTNVLAQRKADIKVYKKTLLSFSKELKRSNIIYELDTTTIDMGVYEKIGAQYFDRNEIEKGFQQDTSFFNLSAKFSIMQQSIGVLHRYLKNIPPPFLSLIPYTQLNKIEYEIGEKDDPEIEIFQNALVLFYNDRVRAMKLMVIFFNKKNGKILYLTPFGKSVEDTEYILKKMKL